MPVAAVILAAGIMMPLSVGYSAGTEAEAALVSDEQVAVTVLADGYAIGPEDAERRLVFYPGGRHAGFGDYGPHPETEIRTSLPWNRGKLPSDLLPAVGCLMCGCVSLTGVIY